MAKSLKDGLRKAMLTVVAAAAITGALMKFTPDAIDKLPPHERVIANQLIQQGISKGEILDDASAFNRIAAAQAAFEKTLNNIEVQDKIYGPAGLKDRDARLMTRMTYVGQLSLQLSEMTQQKDRITHFSKAPVDESIKLVEIALAKERQKIAELAQLKF